MIILNLTQHKGTPEQQVVEPESKQVVKDLLTFKEIPSRSEMIERAEKLAALVQYHQDCSPSGDMEEWGALIGGAPYFMSTLEGALKGRGITPLYSFSERVSSEKDGIKTSVFKHVGFVQA